MWARARNAATSSTKVISIPAIAMMGPALTKNTPAGVLHTLDYTWQELLCMVTNLCTEEGGICRIAELALDDPCHDICLFCELYQVVVNGLGRQLENQVLQYEACISPMLPLIADPDIC